MKLLKQKTKDNLGIAGIVLGLITIVLLLSSGILMWCWDYIMPSIFGLPEITFWQAVIMNILSTLLFKTYSYKGSND